MTILPNHDDTIVLAKLNEMLPHIRQEMFAVRARAQNPANTFTDTDWECVAEEARFYAHLYLTTHEVKDWDLSPSKVVEHAVWSTQQLRAAGGNAALMERFNRLFDAVKKELTTVLEGDPLLTIAEATTVAQRRVAIRYPLDAPITWRGESLQPN
jgi:hypothetical protein